MGYSGRGPKGRRGNWNSSLAFLLVSKLTSGDGGAPTQARLGPQNFPLKVGVVGRALHEAQRSHIGGLRLTTRLEATCETMPDEWLLREV